MPIPQTSHCTYADYLSWDTEDKYELFDGIPILQARPSIAHQNIEAAILQQLRNYLDEKPCNAYAEIEVLLPKSAQQHADDVSNVFIPDIAVICDPEKLKEQHCLGAPTMIVEILSPSTAKADKLIKLNTYQAARVPEYWIVSPQEQTAMVFTLQSEHYEVKAVYTVADTAAEVFCLPGCTLDMSKIFRSV